jgi:hypothetical protein
MRPMNESLPLEQLLVTSDEVKLVEKYRECMLKLQPGMEVPVGRAWSFPLIDSSGDQIHCSVSVSHSSWEPKSSSAEVIVERAKARLD